MDILYIIPTSNHKIFKIGISQNIATRIFDLSQFYEFDLSEAILVQCENRQQASELEASLIYLCSPCRMILSRKGGRDFFDYNIFNELKAIVDFIIKYHKLQYFNIVPQDIKIKKILNNDDLFLHELGNKIRSKRIEMRLSQVEFAKLCNVNENIIKRLELGRNFGVKNMLNILNALNLSLPALEYTAIHTEGYAPRKRRGMAIKVKRATVKRRLFDSNKNL